MRMVSPLLKHVVYPGLSRWGFLRAHSSPPVAVVTYHGVFPADYRSVDRFLDGNLITASQLRRHLQFLKTHYQVISPEDFARWCRNEVSLPPRAVLLTCDDGLRNNVTEMLPVLREFEMRCLFFVTSSSLSETGNLLWHEQLCLMILAAPSPFTLRIPELGVNLVEIPRHQKHQVWQEMMERLSCLDGDGRQVVLEEIRQQTGLSRIWDAAYREDPNQSARFLTMNLGELRELVASDMTVGAHSVSHPRLTRMSSQNVRVELQRNREDLCRVLGREVWALAYPFGDPSSVSEREIALAQQSRFTCAFLNVEDSFVCDRNLFALPRVHVTGDLNCAELDARISGVHASLRQLLA